MAILIHFIFLFTYTQHSSPTLNWHTQLEPAIAEAQSEEKSILMVFSGSDWCKPCIRLNEEVFEQTSFANSTQERFSLLKVDFPRRRKNKLAQEIIAYRASLAEKYNPKGYFPWVLILDKEGNKIRKIEYKGGGLQSFLQQLN
ncbi:MAG: thioredoxin family protein [Bacteroidota bacterium]